MHDAEVQNYISTRSNVRKDAKRRTNDALRSLARHTHRARDGEAVSPRAGKSRILAVKTSTAYVRRVSARRKRLEVADLTYKS